ncbi:CBASS oligonucleotide cyclase [Planctomycetes bacterium TBK1r]|uniref:Nucleotidyltransferase n=1 Tax=Stieleria magnilauensis TaxID=2527963 RepID=A0ABX5XVS8_9BACT|nr:hypothetical protein TBK1r_43810 [Planctomycetes bacterium TBK1r]
MRDEFVKHSDLAAFADSSVNLKREDAKEYREQVNRLRTKMEAFIKENPDVGLRKMLLSGSLAKGTALKSLNDIDVAIHVTSPDAPTGESDLLDWLVEQLRKVYPNMNADQISRGNHCVRISFRGSGLDVDVVPIYEIDDDPLGRGYLYASDSGNRVLTSIPMHLDFIRKRKASCVTHYAQMIRFAKFWSAKRKIVMGDSFRCKSFLVELLMAKRLDSGAILSNYPDALEEFFAYIVQTRLSDQIAFTDYFKASEIPDRGPSSIEILDPVNLENSIVADYSESDRNTLVDQAEDALDAISEARHATTKGRAIECWKEVFGPTFKV